MRRRSQTLSPNAIPNAIPSTIPNTIPKTMAHTGDSSGGRWRRAGTILVVLLVLVLFGYALLGNRRVENLFGIDVQGVFETYVTGSDGARYSTEGIFRAVETDGWSPSGASGRLKTEGREAFVQKFERDSLQVTVQVIPFESVEAASKYAGEVSEPRGAVPFDRKVAVVELRGAEDAPGSAPFQSLLQQLRDYRRMSRESED